jgi:hypothetical protein
MWTSLGLSGGQSRLFHDRRHGDMIVLVATAGAGARVKPAVTAPLARHFGAMLALMFVVSGAVRAGPVFSFDATPGKLP